MIKNNHSKQCCRLKKQRGFSLFEIIVVIAVFIVIIMISSQALFSTLRGSAKSQVSTRIKEAAAYAFDLMERDLRQSRSISTCTPTAINYINVDGLQSSFSCSAGSLVNTSGTRMTPDDISVASCNFSCSTQGPSTWANLEVTFKQSGDAASLKVEEVGTYQLKNQILLRN